MKLVEDVREYWNLRSDGFSKSVNDETDSRGTAVSETLECDLGAKPGDRILDVGCGPGFFTMVLSERGMRVTGIDYSEEMLEKAKVNASAKGIEPEFVRMDACNLEFGDCSFDGVVSRNVLWNLVDPAKAYSEMLRVLKPGKRAVVMDGNFYLYLYDEDFRKMHQENQKRWKEKSAEPAGGHEKHRGDVDFGIIEKLAEDMPLSRELRPAWDLGVLQKLPCSSVEVVFPPMQGTGDGEGRKVTSFKIVITKEA